MSVIASGVNAAPDNLPLHLKYRHEKIEAFREHCEKKKFNITEDILEILWSEILDFDFVKENATPEVMGIYLDKNGSGFNFENLFETLCAKGEIGPIEWYIDKYGINSADANEFMNLGYTTAAANGHLHVIEFLLSREIPLVDVDVIPAAARGHLGVIQFLQAKGVRCDIVGILGESSYNGHLEIVQWAYNLLQNPYYTKTAIALAAVNGKIEVVRWLCSIQGASCTELAIDCAAGMGHYEVVKFLNENMNSGFTFSAIAWAKSEGHNSIVDYLCLGSFRYLSIYASPHFEDYVVRYLNREVNYGNSSGEGCEFIVEDGVVCSVQARIEDLKMFCMYAM